MLGYPYLISDGGSRALGELPSCEKYVDEGTPPTFIFHTCEDPVVPVSHSVRFAQVLHEKGIPFEMHIFQWGDHGMATGREISSNGFAENVNQDFAQWIPLCSKWLFNTFGQFKTERHMFSYTRASDVGGFNLDVRLEDLLSYPEARAAVLEYLPEIEKHHMPNLVKKYSLTQYAKFDPASLSETALKELGEKLKAIAFNKD